jgi:hypothetical protein
MMAVRLRLRIETGNVGFVSAPEAETVAALRKVADTIEAGFYTAGVILDRTGYTVGSWSFDPEHED